MSDANYEEENSTHTCSTFTFQNEKCAQRDSNTVRLAVHYGHVTPAMPT